MRKSLERQVRHRAAGACEYCQVPESRVPLAFEIDHVVARQHGGRTEAANLALTCLRCNKRKGTNLAGIDPETDSLVRLFNPRKDDWSTHFEWDAAFIRGLTPIGRATVVVLDLNNPTRVQLRETLIAEGEFPPR